MINKFTANTDMRFDDSVLAEGTAARVENFDVTGGALTDGWGISSDPRFDGVSAGAENEMAPWGQAGRQSPSPSQTFSRTSSALPSTSSMAPS